MAQSSYFLGIDLGSTTVKYVLLDNSKKVLAKDYLRHQSAVIPVLQNCLKSLNDKFNLTDVYINLTGSSALYLAQHLKVAFIQEVIAATAFLKSLPEPADTAVELGGEDGKIIFLTNGVELRMNEACAGGTGAFIDQMATLLNTDAAGVNELAKKAQKIYPIASRCGVFAKTDLVALLNQGVSREDIAKSVFDAVCEQAIGGLACGRAISGNVCFLGGPLTFLSELKESFKDKLNDKNTKFLEVEDSQYAIAKGSALALINEINDPLLKEKPQGVNLADIIKALDTADFKTQTVPFPALFNNEDEIKAFKERHNKERIEELPLSEASGDLFLGIDLGSTTIKSVLIDANCRMVDSFYANNQGEPLKRLLPKIKDLLKKLPQGAHIRSICTTGYGADLAKAALNAQFSEVETLSHQKAAYAFDPETSYVIDIGGQDMKCIKVKNGVIKGMQLNEACSSGCGSFIETFANQLNLKLEDFVNKAISSKSPCDLGTRCTVFMNSKVKQAQRDNVKIEDIASGLCLSIVRNALYKVLRIHDPSELGDHVVVQGGTFLNDAILRAFEMLVGKNVIRPNIAGLMGAFGAALLAKDRTTADTKELNLTDEVLSLDGVTTRQFRCKGCNNHCLLTMNTFKSGQKLIQGNRCDFAKRGGNKVKESAFIDWKLKKLFSREILSDDKAVRGVIGIPRVLNIYEHYPYWHRLFTELKFKVEISPASSKQIAELGNLTIPSQSLCYPAKLTHGHVVYLASLGIKNIFLPCIPREGKVFEESVDTYACPVVAGYPEALRLNVIKQYPGLKIFTPFLNLTKDSTVLKAVLECFPDIPRHEIKLAIRKARETLDEYRNELRKEGEKIFYAAKEKGQTLIVLAGRPYHIDPHINHGIPALIDSMGAAIVTEDAICHLAAHKVKLDVINQWAFHSRLYRAAQVVIENPHAELVQLVSFGCGIDAITSEQIKKQLEKNDRIYTMLKIDEGDTLGAAKIRLKSLLCAVGNAPEEPEIEEDHEPSLQNFNFMNNNLPFPRTLYVPQMAPIHFPILTEALASLGYRVKLLPEVSDKAIELGLKYVNNDACYPAIVVIGQLIESLVSGKLDSRSTAFLLSQTCGPCRATNYPALLKWALDDLGYNNVPIVTLSSSNIDSDALRLKLGLKGLSKLLRAVLYGDLIQKLYFYCKTYEINKGDSDAALKSCTQDCLLAIKSKKKHVFTKTVRAIIKRFTSIKLRDEKRPRVGIVGEILLKYHPKANLDLMQKIIDEGAEPVLGDISSFVLYCFNDSIYQARHLKGSRVKALGSWIISSRFNRMRNIIMKALSDSHFENLTPFNEYKQAVEGLVSIGQQAGEGWLLTAEMVDFIEHGINNVLCVQPFACLPNHVTGKGVMRAVRDKYATANLCSIDFEAGTAQSNVSNRLKLFLTQAKEIEAVNKETINFKNV